VLQTLKLSSPLGGTPALHDKQLLLPLADGTLLRQPLDGKPGRTGSWRSTRGDRSSVGHILSVGADVYITLDGVRGVTRWRWGPADDVPKLETSTELPARIVGTPALIPNSAQGADKLIAVADTAGKIRTLRVNDLNLVREWDVKGKVTAGPYALGDRLACVVDGNKLLCFEPDQDDFWTYVSEGSGVVGKPMMVGEYVIVADRAGTIVALDQATGMSRGAGHQLSGSAAPAAAPVGFGAGTLFVPLTDGTAVTLSLDRLTEQAN
jgi:hypothetical protein